VANGCVGGPRAVLVADRGPPINDLGTLQVTVRPLTEASFAIASLHRAL
jgi:hypothetical protein